MMLGKLLQRAASEGKIVGVRVQPPRGDKYWVTIRVGPTLGQRVEVKRSFNLDIPYAEAIDSIASEAASALTS